MADAASDPYPDGFTFLTSKVDTSLHAWNPVSNPTDVPPTKQKRALSAAVQGQLKVMGRLLKLSFLGPLGRCPIKRPLSATESLAPHGCTTNKTAEDTIVQ